MPNLLALIAAFCWGAGDYLGGVAAKRDNQFAVTFTRELVELPLVLIAAVIIGGSPNSADVLIGIVCGALAVVLLPLFFKTLSHGRMGIVAPVTGTIGASIPVIVGLINGERPSGLQLLGVLFAVFGIGLISMVKETEEAIAKHSRPLLIDVRDAAICGAGFGSLMTLLHYVSDDAGAWANAVTIITSVTLLTVFGLITRRRLMVARPNIALNAVGATTDLTAFVAYSFAVRVGLLSLTAILASLYPVITALLAWKFQKETFDRMHQAGLAASVASLILISAG